MYEMTRWLHSQIRWVFLILIIIAVVQAYQGWTGNKPWSKKINLFAMIAADIQLVLGLLLYFSLSPVVQVAMKNMKGAMKNSALRFWAVEHISLMILAIILIHIGFARAKKLKEDAQKHKSIALFFTFALVAILAAMPWPFMAKITAPWFRLGLH